MDLETRLDDGYEPHPFDVICRHNRERISHIGNNRFRVLVEMRVDRYMAAKTRSDKSAIVREIIHQVRSSGGRFIRPHDGVDGGAVESNSTKTRRRQEQYQQQQQQRDDCCSNPDDDNNDDAHEADSPKHTIVYFDIGNKKAADKVGHAMRQALAVREATSLGHRRSSWPSLCSTAKANHTKRSNGDSFPTTFSNARQEDERTIGFDQNIASASSEIYDNYQNMPDIVSLGDHTGIKRRASVAGVVYHHHHQSQGWDQIPMNTFYTIAPTNTVPFVDTAIETWKASQRVSPCCSSAHTKNGNGGYDDDETLSSFTSSFGDEEVNEVVNDEDEDDESCDSISLSSHDWNLSDLQEDTTTTINTQVEQGADICSLWNILLENGDEMLQDAHSIL